MISWRTRLFFRLGFRLSVWGILLGLLAGMVWQLVLGSSLITWKGWLGSPLLGAILSVGIWDAWQLVHCYKRDANHWWRLLYVAIWGAIVGLLAFSITFGITFGGAFLPARPSLFLPLLLALVAGSCAGYWKGRVSGLRRGLLGLGVGMLVGGVWAIILLTLIAGKEWLVLALWSAGWLLMWIALPKIVARRWLRILNGPLEDMCYPLWGDQLRIGSDVGNQVVLSGYHAVYPFHGYLERFQGYYRLVDNQQGGEILANYRHFALHRLESGDLLKLGEALLQVGGRLPAEIVREKPPQQRMRGGGNYRYRGGRGKGNMRGGRRQQRTRRSVNN